jgi:hypothetical protein
LRKIKTKIHHLKDACGTEGERLGTLLQSSSSLEKMKLKESHSDSSDKKEESRGSIAQITHT